MKNGRKVEFVAWWRSENGNIPLREATAAATPERLAAFDILYPRIEEDEAYWERMNRWAILAKIITR